jgi:hypothetical protein
MRAEEARQRSAGAAVEEYVRIKEALLTEIRRRSGSGYCTAVLEEPVPSDVYALLERSFEDLGYSVGRYAYDTGIRVEW